MLDAMQPREGESYLDLTAGYGGHASAFLATNRKTITTVFWSIADFAMRLRITSTTPDKGATLRHTDFVTAAKQLAEEGKTIFADLRGSWGVVTAAR